MFKILNITNKYLSSELKNINLKSNGNSKLDTKRATSDNITTPEVLSIIPSSFAPVIKLTKNIGYDKMVLKLVKECYYECRNGSFI